MRSTTRQRHEVTATHVVAAEHGALLSAKVTVPATPVPAGTPTVVMAHGWTSTRQAWRPVTGELERHLQVRIVTYDQRGHGRSTMGIGIEPSIKQLGRDLHTIITALAPEGPIVLVGHSMGGMTIMAYAGLYPDEMRARVRGVTLVSTAATIDGRTPIPFEAYVMRMCQLAPAIPPGLLVPVWAHRGRIFGHSARREDVREALRQVQRTKMPTIGKYFTALSQLNEVEALSQFEGIPTHVLVGSHDQLTPLSLSRLLAERIPGARLTVLAGLGHMLPYEAKETVAAAVLEQIQAALDRAA